MIFLRSSVFAIFQIVTVIPYAFACLLWAPLPLPLRYKLTMGWTALTIWGAKHICGVQWQMIGRENLLDAPAVVLSKHQSAWETLFLPSHLPRELCFVYKKELNRVPFFGWGIALLDMIAIDRSNKRDAFEQVVTIGQEKLDQGRWPILFPEGTRIAPGQMGRFKAGGAILACRTGVPVIPVAHNAGECWPRNAFFKKPGLITVSIGPAIPSTGLTPAELNSKVFDWIDAEMRRLNPERYPA